MFRLFTLQRCPAGEWRSRRRSARRPIDRSGCRPRRSRSCTDVDRDGRDDAGLRLRVAVFGDDVVDHGASALRAARWMSPDRLPRTLHGGCLDQKWGWRAVRLATTGGNRVRFGLQRTATGIKRQGGTAADTAGNQEIAHLYFLDPQRRSSDGDIHFGEMVAARKR